MKTAVIYSGQARTFGEVFPNQYDKVLRLLPSPEFFVSVADDAQAPAMTRLWECFPKASVHIEHVKQPQLPEPPPDPKWLQMYPPSATPQAILRQLWSLNRAWEFFQATAKGLCVEVETHGGSYSKEVKFDIIVRLRPDLAFFRFEEPIQWDRCSGWHDWSCYTPWWSRWGGVNDRMALLGQEAAKHYFTTFTKIERLRAAGCPLHPETLVDRSLRDGGIQPSHTLATEFRAIRLDGSVTPVDPTVIDIAEYSRASR